MNLVVNAKDAMPTGGRLTIETRNFKLEPDQSAFPDLKPGLYVQLTVSDTGSGMTDEVKNKIFEPFFTTKGIGKGTGLGLAVVHGIIKQCEGAVQVESFTGQGTIFKLLFPIAKSLGGETESEFVRMASRGTETILLVEDEDEVRTISRIALETQGFRVLAAANGDAALQIIQEYLDPIHLLVTDVVMPGMGGRQVAEAMRALRPGILVLYMSGYTDDAVVHHGIVDGIDAFIQKPFTPLSLARKARSVLDGAS